MMETKTNLVQELIKRVKASGAPDALKTEIGLRLEHLSRFQETSFFLDEVYRYQRYLKWVLSIPWGRQSQDNLDIDHVKQVLDKHHYGLERVKVRILEYLAVMKLRQSVSEPMRAPVIMLTGLVGTGKTTFAYALAEALGRRIIRIPFGGLASAYDLRGRSYLGMESEPGLIIQALVRSETMNPVILLDEIDRVVPSSRAEIMGVLVELLDPAQNHSFRDYFIDYPVDLSAVFFIATSNNVQNIATAVLDRLETIEMTSYSDKEKITIAQKYLLPEAIASAGLPPESLKIQAEVWPLIIRPIGYEAGVRTLKRIIESIVRQIALKLARGQAGPYVLNQQNYRQFLPSYLT